MLGLFVCGSMRFSVGGRAVSRHAARSKQTSARLTPIGRSRQLITAVLADFKRLSDEG